MLLLPSSFEVWLGSSAGDKRVRCGSNIYNAATEPQPYMVACSSESSFSASFVLKLCL